MKDHARSISQQALRLTVTLMLVCTFAQFHPENKLLAVAAQTTQAGSCTPRPDGNISKDEVTRFDNKEASIKDDEAQANHDYANAKLRCKADPKPSACIVTAEKKFQEAQIAVQKSRNTNDATRQKALIDAEAAKDECNVTGQTAAEKNENLRHFHALIDFKKKRVDVELKYKNAKLGCGRYTEVSPADSGGAKSSDKPSGYDDDGAYNNFGHPKGCVSNAEKEYKNDQINLEADTNDENFTHEKNLRKILSGPK